MKESERITLKYVIGWRHPFIPTTSMDLIQKYIGAEGKEPRLNKLGGTEWTKVKARVKDH